MIDYPDGASSTEIKMLDGVFVKSFALRDTGMMVHQHSHTYPHISVLVKGSIRVWKEGVFYGDFTAPDSLFIAALVKHRFQTLLPGTTILCVHDIGTADAVDIVEDDHPPTSIAMDMG